MDHAPPLSSSLPAGTERDAKETGWREPEDPYKIRPLIAELRQCERAQVTLLLWAEEILTGLIEEGSVQEALEDIAPLLSENLLARAGEYADIPAMPFSTPREVLRVACHIAMQTRWLNGQRATRRGAQAEQDLSVLLEIAALVETTLLPLVENQMEHSDELGPFMDLHRTGQRGGKYIEGILQKTKALIWARCYRYHPRFHDDLYPAGALGIRRACADFDLHQGTEFSTVATEWIRQSIHREYLALRGHPAEVSLLSIDNQAPERSGKSGRGMTWSDILIDRKEVTSHRKAMRSEQDRALRTYFGALSHEEQMILELLSAREKEETSLAAEILEMPRDRIRQAVKRIVRNARSSLVSLLRNPEDPMWDLMANVLNLDRNEVQRHVREEFRAQPEKGRIHAGVELAVAEFPPPDLSAEFPDHDPDAFHTVMDLDAFVARHSLQKGRISPRVPRKPKTFLTDGIKAAADFLPLLTEGQATRLIHQLMAGRNEPRDLAKFFRKEHPSLDNGSDRFVQVILEITGHTQETVEFLQLLIRRFGTHDEQEFRYIRNPGFVGLQEERRMLAPSLNRIIARHFASVVGPQSGRRLLHIGAGTGHVTSVLEKRFDAVQATEIALPLFIQLMKRRSRTFQARHVDARNTPSIDRSTFPADVVLLSNIMKSMGKDEADRRVLRWSQRKILPGGIGIVVLDDMVPSPQSRARLRQFMGIHETAGVPTSYKTWLESQGYGVDIVRPSITFTATTPDGKEALIDTACMMLPYEKRSRGAVEYYINQNQGSDAQPQWKFRHTLCILITHPPAVNYSADGEGVQD